MVEKVEIENTIKKGMIPPDDYDPQIDMAIITMVEISSKNPSEETDEYKEMVECGELILKKEREAGYVYISPFLRMMIGENVSTVLRDAFLKAKLLKE